MHPHLGRVAAANSVSDIYAMGAHCSPSISSGGTPTSCRRAAGRGADRRPGGSRGEAGFVIAGGHTIDDPEPKYGMAVTGEADPDRLLAEHRVARRAGIVPTKALGVGVLTTAIKNGRATRADGRRRSRRMVRLNDVGANLALAAGMTGHRRARGFWTAGPSRPDGTRIPGRGDDQFAAVPFLPGAVDLAADGVMPCGRESTQRLVGTRIRRRRRRRRSRCRWSSPTCRPPAGSCSASIAPRP